MSRCKSKQYWEDQKRKKAKLAARSRYQCGHIIVDYKGKSFCLSCGVPVEPLKEMEIRDANL